jgi:hypothetical protein
MQEAKRNGAELPKIMILLDSAGNLATQKEIDDATSGSDKADMTRAKLLKSAFRILMTKLGICKIPFIFTNNTYVMCENVHRRIFLYFRPFRSIKRIQPQEIVFMFFEKLDFKIRDNFFRGFG